MRISRHVQENIFLSVTIDAILLYVYSGTNKQPAETNRRYPLKEM